jgi:hypothetical protein
MQNKLHTSKYTWQLSLARATRALYFFIVLYMLSIVVFDSGNLITKEAIVDRWMLATILLVVNTFVWFSASQKWVSVFRKLPIVLLTAVLIAFAGYITYWERGMASTSTIFYVLPILIVALTRSRHALVATAIVSAGVYTYAAVKYFNDFFNEGYRIQLWGSILLILSSIATVTWLTMILVGLRKESE